MLQNIISEIAAYEQVANDANVPDAQREHAILMSAGLFSHLRREYNLTIREIIAMIDALDSAETQ